MVSAFVVASALAVPSAAAAAAWLPSFPVSGPAGEDSESFLGGVTATPAGDHTVVYEDGQPAGSSSVSSVVARTFGADGSEGPERSVSAPGGNVSEVVSDGAADGTTTVAWRQGGLSSGALWMRRISPAGVPLGTPTEVAPAGSIFRVAIDVNASGQALIAWYDDDLGEVRHRRVAADGTLGPVGDLSDLGSDPEDSFQDGPAIALDDTGRGFAAWMQFDGDETECCRNLELTGRTLNDDGSLDPIRNLEEDSGYPGDLVAAIDPGGKGTVLWDTNPPASGPQMIYAAQIDAAGAIAGSVRELSTPDRTAYSQRAAVAADGTVTVLFYESRVDGACMCLRQIAPDGSVVGAAPGELAAGYDALGLERLPGGGALAFYTVEDENSDGDFYVQAVAQRIADDGSPVGSPDAISPAEGRVEGYLAAAAAPDGTALAAYERIVGDDFFSTYTQVDGTVYDATPPEADAIVPASGTAGQELVVGATGSDRTPVGFAWDFGDGGTASGSVVRHTFAAPGTYTVEVTVSDGAGNETTESREITISDEPGGGGGSDPEEPRGESCSAVSRGTDDAESLRGTAGSDALIGLGGDDVLRALGGDDCVEGGTGDDRLLPGSGTDLTLGGGGRDVVKARGGGADLVDCGPGKDRAVVDRGDAVTGCERVKRQRR